MQHRPQCPVASRPGRASLTPTGAASQLSAKSVGRTVTDPKPARGLSGGARTFFRVYLGLLALALLMASSGGLGAMYAILLTLPWSALTFLDRPGAFFPTLVAEGALNVWLLFLLLRDPPERAP